MKKILTLFTLVAGMALMTGCLKDTVNLDPEKSNNVIEFKNLATISSPSTSKYPKYSISFDVTSTYDLNLVVNYAGAEPTAPQDIVVDIAVDATVVSTYNTDNGTSYVPLPSNLYTSTTKVTIPQGQRSAVAKFVLKPNQFDLTKSYALGVKITNTSFGVVSGNFGAAVYTVTAKNKYDGVYKVTGTMVDVASSSLTGAYPMPEVWLVTNGPTSVEFFDNYYGLSGHVIRTGTGGLSYYGNFCPIFTFDGNNNVTSVTNLYGQGTNSSTRGARLDVSGINKWTDANGKIKLEVKYVMTQASAGGDRTFFTELMEFIGPRP
jgi:hypothetical protein